MILLKNRRFPRTSHQYFQTKTSQRNSWISLIRHNVIIKSLVPLANSRKLQEKKNLEILKITDTYLKISNNNLAKSLQ